MGAIVRAPTGEIAGKPGSAGLTKSIQGLDLDENMNDKTGHTGLPGVEDAGPRGAPLTTTAHRHMGRAPIPTAKAPPPLVDPLRDDAGSVLGTHQRRERITARINTTKSGYLKVISATNSQPIAAYQAFTASMQNDGTTALGHAEHAFRYIILFIPLNGPATDRLTCPGKSRLVAAPMEILQGLFPGVQQSAIVTHRGEKVMKLKFNNLVQLRAARLEGWKMGFLP